MDFLYANTSITCNKITRGWILDIPTISVRDSGQISLTSNNKIIDDIKHNVGPENYKINIGYAGWDKGQLEDEIKNGDWLIKPFSQNFLFNIL